MRQSPHLLSAFRDIDVMLTKIDEMILASRSHSPFNDYLTQLSAEQQKNVDHGMSELRTAMICLLRHRGIIANDPHINTAWAIRQTLIAAASRFEGLMDGQGGIGADESANDEESTKLLLQMRNAFIRTNRFLSESEATSVER
jgi:hypothetical protein